MMFIGAQETGYLRAPKQTTLKNGAFPLGEGYQNQQNRDERNAMTNNLKTKPLHNTQYRYTMHTKQV